MVRRGQERLPEPPAEDEESARAKSPESGSRLESQRVAARTASASIGGVFLDSMIENIPHVIFVKDAEHLRYTRFNRAGEELLGRRREELLGRSDFDLFPREQAEAFQANDREVLRHRVAVDIEEQPVETPAGRRWFHTKKIPLFDEEGHPAFLLGISEDITEKRELHDRERRAHDDLEVRVAARTAELLRANEALSREIHERKQAEAALRASEDHLRHAQKMEAIGRLAGGVAHDFNNILSVIIGYAQVLGTELPEGSAQAVSAREIHGAALRAAKLTKQLLAFGRKQVLTPRVLDLSEVIADMTGMLGRIIGEDVELTVVTDDGLLLTRLDPTQVEQVVMNLVVNARDAMPRGGKLVIETRNVTDPAELSRAHLSRGTVNSSAAVVVLTVSDTGEGMDAATKARIFEPFFTTKEDARGTGLGLSTVFGIVQQSGGSILVDSEVGCGTTFRAYFPATDERETSPADDPARELAPPLDVKGHETILLVEDEPQVRALVRRLLALAGYRVVEADSAERALTIAREHNGPLDLLLTDVVMPRTGGPELARSVAEARPGMKVLFMSGYTTDSDELTGSPVAEKPLAIDRLPRMVREVLDADPELSRRG
jgi:PAS domain S-box-containing protein